MAKEIVVALIAVGGVIFSQVVTYAISRISAKDLRTNIVREVDIIRKLMPGSPEVEKLERHVRSSIDKLVTRDERREQLSEILWTSAPLPLMVFAIAGLEVWRGHGVPALLRVPVTFLYWGLIALLVWQFSRSLWRTGKFVYVISALWFQAVVNKAKLRLHIRKARKSLLTGRVSSNELMERILASEDLVREKVGEELWEQLVGIGPLVEKKYAQIEEDLADQRRKVDDIKPVRHFFREWRSARRKVIDGEAETPPSV